MRLREPSPANWIIDPVTGIAKRDRTRVLRTEIETCGRCHVRRGVVTEDYVDGGSFRRVAPRGPAASASPPPTSTSPTCNGLRAGLTVAPDNPALWRALRLALVRQHRTADALQALEKATALDPASRRFAEVYRIAQAELAPRSSVGRHS